MLLLYIVPTFLNHMTFITKVGVAYVDHMNDDVLKVALFRTSDNRFSLRI